MAELENAEFFRLLKPAELASVKTAAQDRTFAADQKIFREGDPGDGLYVVKSGQVEISGTLSSGRRQVFSQIGPGQIFGEMAVIEQLPRSACAIAVQPTAVAFLSRDEMQKLIEKTPTLATALLQLVSHRLREFDRHYLREVVQAERLAAVGQFARSIIHDLKNPLNIIGLTTELFGRADATEATRAAAKERITRQLDRINGLVTDMLQFTQDSQALTFAQVNYERFIHQLVGELQPEFEYHSITLQYANPPPAVTLRMDAKRLRRVFYNLTHNAADAMGDKGALTLRFSQANGELITELADTGPGIAPEIIERLFQPFATHGKAHGSGLGLSICKKIVEDHGGHINARNDPAGGAVFSFALPLHATPKP
ncbi:MAG: cyclic nucleotide-binding domain-containing protein [Verrucomicrobiota bacterium]